MRMCVGTDSLQCPLLYKSNHCRVKNTDLSLSIEQHDCFIYLFLLSMRCKALYLDSQFTGWWWWFRRSSITRAGGSIHVKFGYYNLCVWGEASDDYIHILVSYSYVHPKKCKDTCWAEKPWKESSTPNTLIIYRWKGSDIVFSPGGCFLISRSGLYDVCNTLWPFF